MIWTGKDLAMEFVDYTMWHSSIYHNVMFDISVVS